MDILDLLVIFCVAALGTIAGFYLARRNARLGLLAKTAGSAVDAFETVDDSPISGDVVVLGENGEVLVSCYEINDLPPKRETLRNEAGMSLTSARQLVADFVTREMSVPGKTIQIVFDPSVQKGLAQGNLELVKVARGEGHRLIARASDSKKYVGQGRLIESRNLRSLGSSIFHIASIAVAQAHLADINKNLDEIKANVQSIRDFLEDQDVARLKGTIEYLDYVVDYIGRLESPEKFPPEKRAELESIRRDLMTWSVQVGLEADRLQAKIKNQNIEDFVGTGNTFSKLHSHAIATEQLIQKHGLVLRIETLLYMTAAYLDPLALRDRDAVRISSPGETAKTLGATVDQLENTSSILLADAFFNRKETLQQRQLRIKDKVRMLREVSSQAEEMYATSLQAVKEHLKSLAGTQRHIQIAVTFDCTGNPKQVHMV
jgi:hypothetical protein